MGPDLRRQQTEAVQKGLDLSRVTTKKKPQDASWAAWQFHFHLEKAELKLSGGAPEFRAAEHELAAGLALAESMDLPRVQLIFALAQLQRAVAQRAGAGASGGGGGGGGRAGVGDAADKALAAVEEREGKAACAPMRLHHHVLRMLGRLAEGDVSATAGDAARIHVLLQEETAPSEEVDGDGDGEVANEGDQGYRWLPIAATTALARLLTAEAQRPLGKFADARRELEAAVAACDGALATLGVLPEGGDAEAAAAAELSKLTEAAVAAAAAAAETSGGGGGGGGSRATRGAQASSSSAAAAAVPSLRQWVGCETDLSLRTGANATPYLAIRMLALQALVGVELTSTRLSEAAARAESMRAMVEAYPRVLRRTAAAADMSEGQVLHSLGRQAEAAARFTAAAESAERFGVPATKDLACVCGALAELADGSPEAISRALNLVRPVLARHEAMATAAAGAGTGAGAGAGARGGASGSGGGGGDKDPSAAPNYTHQAAALFVSGYATLRQGGMANEAKPKLSRALKLAHSQCCNHQLVAQSLSLIGTIVLDTKGGDLSQSLDMLQSSFTLSKAQEDLPAQMGCLQSLLRLHRIRGSNKEEQDALTSYHKRKLAALDERVAAAAGDEARLRRLAGGGGEEDPDQEMEDDEGDEMEEGA
jgi:MAternally-affected-uncoordination protein